MPKRPPSSSEPWSSHRRADERPSLTGAALILLIRVYRLLVAPGLPPACRFTPSCSAFAMEAIARHGALHGLGLALGRVARCHPWHAGGHDPVPGLGG